MGWITPDYRHLTVTSDAGGAHFGARERSRTPPLHGRQSRDATARGLRLPHGLRAAANAPPWRDGRSTSTSELVPPRSA